MIVALDITAAPAGAIDPVALGLIDALTRGGSPARRLVLIARPEHRPDDRGPAVLTLELPGPGRRGLADYRRRKLELIADHRIDVLHAVGGPLDAPQVSVPTVLHVAGLDHRRWPEQFTAAERGRMKTWWTASAFRADSLVVATAAAADELCDDLSVDGGKVFVAPPSPASILPTLFAAYGHAARGHRTRKAA